MESENLYINNSFDSIKNPADQYVLGTIYYHKKEPEKAFILYKLSADQGYNKAIHALADLYEYGDGVQKNIDIALDFYRKNIFYTKSILRLERLEYLISIQKKIKNGENPFLYMTPEMKNAIQEALKNLED
jgi:TPR repeat protein